METEKPQKELSSTEKLAKRLNELLIAFFDKLKFKEGEHWFKKFIKITIRVLSILFLIAISPLLIVLVLLIIFAAS